MLAVMNGPRFRFAAKWAAWINCWRGRLRPFLVDLMLPFARALWHSSNPLLPRAYCPGLLSVFRHTPGHSLGQKMSGQPCRSKHTRLPSFR